MTSPTNTFYNLPLPGMPFEEGYNTTPHEKPEEIVQTNFNGRTVTKIKSEDSFVVPVAAVFFDFPETKQQNNDSDTKPKKLSKRISKPVFDKDDEVLPLPQESYAPPEVSLGLLNDDNDNDNDNNDDVEKEKAVSFDPVLITGESEFVHTPPTAKLNFDLLMPGLENDGNKSSKVPARLESALEAIARKKRQAQKAKEKAIAKERTLISTSTFSVIGKGSNLDNVAGKIVHLFGEAIAKLKYSQDSIGDATTDGMGLDKLIDNMIESGWLKGTSIKVIKFNDDLLVSLDNRRLFAAKVAFRITKLAAFSISVLVYPCEQQATRALYDKIERLFIIGRGREEDRENLPEGIKSGTFGHCVKMRMHSQNGTLNSDAVGYDKITIRGRNNSEALEKYLGVTEFQIVAVKDAKEQKNAKDVKDKNDKKDS
ncbi:MAG: hypothetical protein H0W88_05135 [Parachlamydiaceae bacterium]|nr:hypothetical protein [Parachlamydiaceae bacterium]